MRILLILILFTVNSSFVNAADKIKTFVINSVRSHEEVPRKPPRRPGKPGKSTSTEDTVNREIPGKNDREKIKAPPLTDSNPRFSELSRRCVRPGDILRINGKNLSALSNTKLLIKANNSVITLKRLTINDTQLITQLPSDKRVQENHTYSIFLTNQQTPLPYQQTKLILRTCSLLSSEHSVNASNNHEPGEILLLIDTNALSNTQLEVRKLRYKVLNHHVLTGLNKSLLTVHVADHLINDAIHNLRRKLPNALIDFNDHYQSSAAPRTYADKMIAWPAVNSCKQYKNLSIGLIDGHVDQTHPALADQTITVKSFLKKTDTADQLHGTAIAVILSGNKADVGFKGLLPGIKIMAASILRKNKNNLIATTEGIIRAIDWLIIQNVRLVNASLSGTRANIILKNIFERAINKGLVFFAAAGNNGKSASQSYPAALPDVIAVTAIDAAKRIYKQANQGSYIDFSAPGVDIWTIDHGVQGKYSSGTSYASPYALAIAASYLAQNNSLSRDILYNAMQKNTLDLGESGHDVVFGWGLLQAQQSLCP